MEKQNRIYYNFGLICIIISIIFLIIITISFIFSILEDFLNRDIRLYDYLGFLFICSLFILMLVLGKYIIKLSNKSLILGDIFSGLTEKYWIIINNQERGAYKIEQLFKIPELNENILIWYKGLEKWIQFKDSNIYNKYVQFKSENEKFHIQRKKKLKIASFSLLGIIGILLALTSFLIFLYVDKYIESSQNPNNYSVPVNGDSISEIELENILDSDINNDIKSELSNNFFYDKYEITIEEYNKNPKESINKIKNSLVKLYYGNNVPFNIDWKMISEVWSNFVILEDGKPLNSTLSLLRASKKMTKNKTIQEGNKDK